MGPAVSPAAKESPLLSLKLRYAADAAALSPQVRARFVQLARDAGTDAFLEHAARGRHGWLRTALHQVLRHFMSDFDSNGWLDMYPLHLGSTDHWQALLGTTRVPRLLDVGAGSGKVTRTLVPLAQHVVATELSRPMARRLRRSGIECHEIDLTERDFPGARFDL